MCASGQAGGGHDRPEHLGVADVAVCAAERRLVCTDDGVGVQAVEPARLEVVGLSLRRQEAVPSESGSVGIRRVPLRPNGKPGRRPIRCLGRPACWPPDTTTRPRGQRR